MLTTSWITISKKTATKANLNAIEPTRLIERRVSPVRLVCSGVGNGGEGDEA
jgi:hypothetical protein